MADRRCSSASNWLASTDPHDPTRRLREIFLQGIYIQGDPDLQGLTCDDTQGGATKYPWLRATKYPWTNEPDRRGTAPLDGRQRPGAPQNTHGLTCDDAQGATKYPWPASTVHRARERGATKYPWITSGLHRVATGSQPASAWLPGRLIASRYRHRQNEGEARERGEHA